MTDERNKPDHAPAISPELVERMVELIRNVGSEEASFSEAVSILVELEPVDPLEAEALAIVLADETTRTKRQEQAIRDGNAGHSKKAIALAALKRGMELAKEQGA